MPPTGPPMGPISELSARSCFALVLYGALGTGRRGADEVSQGSSQSQPGSLWSTRSQLLSLASGGNSVPFVWSFQKHPSTSLAVNSPRSPTTQTLPGRVWASPPDMETTLSCQPPYLPYPPLTILSEHLAAFNPQTLTTPPARQGH